MASVSLFLIFIMKVTIEQVIVRLSVELTGTHKQRNRRLYYPSTVKIGNCQNVTVVFIISA